MREEQGRRVASCQILEVWRVRWGAVPDGDVIAGIRLSDVARHVSHKVRQRRINELVGHRRSTTCLLRKLGHTLRVSPELLPENDHRLPELASGRIVVVCTPAAARAVPPGVEPFKHRHGIQVCACRETENYLGKVMREQ